MTALLYRNPQGWQLMLAISDIRGSFASMRSACNYAKMHGFKIRRSSNLDH